MGHWRSGARCEGDGEAGKTQARRCRPSHDDAQALQNANPQVSNPALIYPGTRLNVPPCQLKQSVKSSASARSQCKRVSYVVKKGDFLYKVANQFSCTVGDVLTLNPAVAKGARLQPGKTITVLSCPLAARSRSAFLNPVHLVAGAKMQQPARG